MTEISLNILDVAQNSIKAEATLIKIYVEIDVANDLLKIEIKDNGRGMTVEQLAQATDPFFTTRTTRQVGLGLPFFKMAAEMTGGSFEISSKPQKGTSIKTNFVLSSIDRMPLGDMCGTMETLIIYNNNIDFIYDYRVEGKGFRLSTAEMRGILNDTPLDCPEVKRYIHDYLNENTEEINKNRIF
ncbi:MAG: ATP-binding protein [Eubacterium sp.]|jgi:hypothetical protein|nr:ATP-binding protein [Eubacterium sp.]